MTRPPWEYLFDTFNDKVFPDLFNPTWIFSLVGIVSIVVLYNVRTRQLRRHPPYLDLYEWLLWTSISLFFLLLVYAIFHFDFIFTVVTIPIGLGGPGLGALRPLPARAGALPAAARQGALLLEAEVRPPRVHDPAEAGPAPPRLRVEIRRFGVGHRRPEGPSGRPASSRR